MRDFVIRCGDETLGGGVATSEWMAIDLATRRLVPVPASVSARASDVRPPVLDGEPFSKPEMASAIRDFEIACAARSAL